MDRGGGWAIVHGVARVRYDLVTKSPPYKTYDFYMVANNAFTFSLLLPKYLI